MTNNKDDIYLSVNGVKYRIGDEICTKDEIGIISGIEVDLCSGGLETAAAWVDIPNKGQRRHQVKYLSFDKNLRTEILEQEIERHAEAIREKERLIEKLKGEEND